MRKDRQTDTHYLVMCASQSTLISLFSRLFSAPKRSHSMPPTGKAKSYAVVSQFLHQMASIATKKVKELNI